ncbi:MAG: ATP phosphoribosyltransferase regulatory subunit [Pseudomonadota bacterium]
MEPRRVIRAEADRLKAALLAKGAEPVEVDVLQPAGLLLDLYGEDIRSRAFVTSDPVMGEVMLRPDFTLPVAEAHLAAGAGAARYAYAGKVFRQQESGSRRPAEFLQVGYEVFGRDGPRADAELFAFFYEMLKGYPLRPVTGDIGLLFAAVSGLATTEVRKAALRRHFWRPRRFRALLDRFSQASTRHLPDPDVAFDGVGPEIGLRSKDDVRARLAALADDAGAPPIGRSEIEVIDALLAVRGTAPDALSELRNIAVDLPAIEPGIGALDARLSASSDAGIAVEALAFEVSYGRTTLEYYDGFVFGFLRDDAPDLPPVASGGRYNALTRALGGEEAPPAAGGVIRPALLPLERP